MISPIMKSQAIEWRFLLMFESFIELHRLIMNETRRIPKKNMMNYKFLFIGCGLSPLPQMIWNKYHPQKLDLIDYNPFCVSYQNKIFTTIYNSGENEINVIEGDITNPSIIEKLRSSYDIIIFTDVLEHIPNDKIAIKNIIKLMHQDSLLFLSVPEGSVDRWILKINPDYMKLSNGKCGHCHFYKYSDIVFLAESNGLETQLYTPLNSGYTLFHILINIARVPVDGDHGTIKPENILHKIATYSGSVIRCIVELPILRKLFNRLFPRTMFYIFKLKMIVEKHE